MTRSAKGLRSQASCVISTALLCDVSGKRLSLGSTVEETVDGKL